MDEQRKLRNLLSYTKMDSVEEIEEVGKLYEELLAYINQQEQFAKDVAKLMYYLEYKEKWTDALTVSLHFYYYKVLNKVGKEE